MCVLKQNNPTTYELIDFPVLKFLCVDLKSVFHIFECLTFSKNIILIFLIFASQRNYGLLLRVFTHLLLPNALYPAQLWQIPLSLVAKTLFKGSFAFIVLFMTSIMSTT